MKRLLIFLTTAIIILTSFGIANAADGDIKVVVNSKEVYFPDQKPYIDENGRTMVPVRFVSESLGADVDWDGVNKKVTVQYGKRQIILLIGESSALVDGLTKTIDTKAVIRKSRTMVPLRFISEALGAEVGWQSDTSTVKVDLSTNGYTLPTKGSSELVVDIPITSDNPNKVDIVLGILMYQPLEPQYSDMQTVLASKFGNVAAQEIVNYVKEKKSEWDELPAKYWTISGQLVEVISPGGQLSIPVTIWQAGGK